MLIFLISLSLGIFIGWYLERLLRYVTRLLERRTVEPGIVRREIAPGAQIQSRGVVVKSKTPKEVAAEQEREFRENFEI